MLCVAICVFFCMCSVVACLLYVVGCIGVWRSVFGVLLFVVCSCVVCGLLHVVRVGLLVVAWVFSVYLLFLVRCLWFVVCCVLPFVVWLLFLMCW